MKISVVIPSYNRPVLLERVLYSLYVQNCGLFCEILVSIDDDLDYVERTLAVCTTYQNKGMILKVFHTHKFKRSPGWSVESYPYNVGIRQASNEIILLNSGDVLSVNNTITQHLEQHEQHPDNKFVLLSTVHGLTEKTTNEIEQHDWRNKPMSLFYKNSCEYMYCGTGKSYSERFQGIEQETAIRPYHYQMSVKKATLEYIRGFDEDFYGGIPGADDDLATRLEAYGCIFNYSPDILAAHQWHLWGSKQSLHGFSETTKCDTINPLNFWEKDRKFKPIIRNASHEWGQYPRDMEKLPKVSGYLTV